MYEYEYRFVVCVGTYRTWRTTAAAAATACRYVKLYHQKRVNGTMSPVYSVGRGCSSTSSITMPRAMSCDGHLAITGYTVQFEDISWLSYIPREPGLPRVIGPGCNRRSVSIIFFPLKNPNVSYVRNSYVHTWYCRKLRTHQVRVPDTDYFMVHGTLANTKPVKSMIYVSHVFTYTCTRTGC